MGQLLNRRNRYSAIMLTIVLLLVGLFMVIPFAYMIAGSLKSPGEFVESPMSLIPSQLYFDNFKLVMTHPSYFLWYLNSTKVVVLVIIFRLVIVTSAAYAFARLEFPFKNVLFLIAISTLLFPSDATLVGRFLTYQSLNLTNSHWSLILPGIADPLMLFLMRQFFMGIPKEISEAALVDGGSHVTIYSKIVLPLAIPAVMTLILFSFIWTWNDFANPAVFITDSNKQLLTVGLSDFRTRSGPIITAQLAGALLALFPSVIIFAFLQKHFVQGVASSAVKG
ncbi:carbohydrate ABC transporter permease [Paenibacillus sp. GCM10012307]|uniref:Carbohydrate ABC transporter permease n=1 Tax=Paenibacillus roseus TaxID=2798579 RepID=A0A934J900_9BACL|nr:carbohydrate ABC transporter permease [Paenibacillus roseus]MBJ6364024.1 carbohydrate ABC transporter permease [Paenibacillus roseus]